MDRYKYSIELRYIKQKERISQEIRSERIRSIIIDRDFKNNNMPVIFATLNLDKQLIDDMIINNDKNTMVLSIYKYIEKDDGSMQTKTRYLHEEMAYFLTDDLNYRASIDYSEDENKERDDITKRIVIGLMGVNSINNNKRTTNVTLRNTTMINAIYYCTSNINMVIERLTYNDTFNELLITPQSSVSAVIKYLNNIKVFYSTPYRFFIDFDCGYLLSSSGLAVPKKGESINSILIIIRDPLNQQAMEEGMITNYNSKNYQLDIPASDTQVYQNRVTEKVYTSVASISEQGESKSQSLNINKSNFSKDKVELIRTPNSNPNLLQNISSANNQSSSHISLNKIDVDVSIFTPNKRYIIRNYDGHKDRDGDFILTRKRELFYFETETQFTGNVMLEFDQVVK